jgi:hypothetical protein
VTGRIILVSYETRTRWLTTQQTPWWASLQGSDLESSVRTQHLPSFVRERKCFVDAVVDQVAGEVALGRLCDVTRGTATLYLNKVDSNDGAEASPLDRAAVFGGEQIDHRGPASARTDEVSENRPPEAGEIPDPGKFDCIPSR